MSRYLWSVPAVLALAVLVLAVSSSMGGLVGGSNSERVNINAHDKKELVREFEGGRRACVIARGDHRPPAKMAIAVYDDSGKKVAEDPGAVDYVAVIWYPPRTGSYRIEIKSDPLEVKGDGTDYNNVYV